MSLTAVLSETTSLSVHLRLFHMSRFYYNKMNFAVLAIAQNLKCYCSLFHHGSVIVQDFQNISVRQEVPAVGNRLKYGLKY